ncbi:DUF4215 domain-containing protein [Candidatus Binatia bacterium]|nr:DUF4215 domain-containing protein [Candidatus Binatia bacterium]
MSCKHRAAGFWSVVRFALGAVTTFLAVPAGGVVIDAFDTAQTVSQAGLGASGNSVDGPAGGLLGGERDVHLSITTGSGTLRADAGMSRSGAFSHAAAGQVRGITQITYDGDDGDPHTLDAAGLDGVDLTVGGSHSSIVVGLPFADLGAAVTLAVWSDATHCSQRTLPAPASTVPADNRRLQFRYGEFGLGPGCVGPANFTNVGAIRLTIDGTAVGATDLSVEQIQTVPEPTPTLTPSGQPTGTPTRTPTPAAVCGNGIVEPPEECEDANTVNGDGCDTNCTATRCGNAIVTSGESCDDGNSVSLDGCENDCTPSPCLKNTDRLIPGYCNTRINDCDHEFCTGFPAAPMVRFGGLPGVMVRCTDDDPTCDVGPPGDHMCTFHVALCFNVQDQRLPCFGLPPKGVSAVRLRRVQPSKTLDVANRTALENALFGIGGVLRVRPGQRFVEFDPPLTAQDRCTTYADFKVPLRLSTGGGFRPGRKMITVTTKHPKVGRKVTKQDSDYLIMECLPR